MTEPYPYALFIAYKTEKFCFSPKHMELLADGAKLVLSIGEFQVDLPPLVAGQVLDAMSWDLQLRADLAATQKVQNHLKVFEPFSPPPLSTSSPPPSPPSLPSPARRRMSIKHKYMWSSSAVVN